VHLRTRYESLVRLCTRSSIFDNVACARLSLTLPGWLLCLCLTRSMCACTQWLLCCALAHEASSSNTCHSSSPVVAVVVAFARRDMKMPCACAQGLIVDAPKASSSTFIVVIAVVVVVVAIKQRDVNASGSHQGPCH
jgi:hypothetical protein